MIKFDTWVASELIDDLEIVCIEVKPKCSSPFVILAWYIPPKYDTFSFTELEFVLKVFDSEDKEIILIGDTNCDQLCYDTKSVDYLKHSIRNISPNILSKTQLV